MKLSNSALVDKDWDGNAEQATEGQVAAGQRASLILCYDYTLIILFLSLVK